MSTKTVLPVKPLPLHVRRKLEEDAKEITKYVSRFGNAQSKFMDEYRDADAWFKQFLSENIA